MATACQSSRSSYPNATLCTMGTWVEPPASDSSSPAHKALVPIPVLVVSRFMQNTLPAARDYVVKSWMLRSVRLTLHARQLTKRQEKWLNQRAPCSETPKRTAGSERWREGEQVQ